MGNCISCSVPLDQTVNNVSQWLDEKRGYIHNLKKNLVALMTVMEELKAKRNDLLSKVKGEEDRGLQRLAEVQVWLDRVETIENRVEDLLGDRDVELQRLCFCGICSKSLISSYRYGKRVVLTLTEVKKLKSEVFEEVASQALTPEVEERQLQPIIVGQKTMVEKAWSHLMDDGVGIMGMYGMGGVGKTTLLTQINNKFSINKCGFEFVIWIVVSKELHVEKIQDEIAGKVGLSGGEWNQKDLSQKAARLYNLLRKKIFVLFLDDIWEKVDLVEIGVPIPTKLNHCKVAFTTRSRDVSARMGVQDPMEVKCLEESDAFDLFQKIVGERTLESDPGIPDLARTVSQKCSGLPLALNVIGETMACKRTIQEWRNAVDVLNSYAIEFSGMEDKILPLLKYSYDCLKGKQVQSGLLYCALYPEDHIISKGKLIENLICEGIIDGSEGIEKAENRGYEIIGSLIRASLLMEKNEYDHELELSVPCVIMHDVVREMALWIASDLGNQKEAFIVRAGVGLCEIPKVKNWNVVKRMSLMENKIVHLPGSPECLQLTTLLLQGTRLRSISSEFFKSMPSLAVLDLSYNEVLSELPKGISKLVSLRYLNLSSTGIHHLPMGLQELKQLIHLELERTRYLHSIDGISCLHNLKVLKLLGSRLRCGYKLMEELETLEHLEILTTTISEIRKYFSSHRLTICTRILHIDGRDVKPSRISLPEDMDKLLSLSLFECSISEIMMARKCSFFSLVTVRIEYCKCLRELTFLMFVPNLTRLRVDGAYKLEDIINKERACEVEASEIVPFQKLVELDLCYLPQLKSIYWSPLPFPCLDNIFVDECPNLKKLPLDSKSCKKGENGFSIKYYDQEWMEGLEWEDEATKIRFSSCMVYW